MEWRMIDAFSTDKAATIERRPRSCRRLTLYSLVWSMKATRDQE